MFLLFPSAFRKDWQNKYHQNGHQPCHYWHSHLKHQLCQSLPLCQCFCFPLLWGVFSERIVQHIKALNEYLPCNLILVPCYPRKQPPGEHSALRGVTPPKGGAQRGVTPPSFEMPLWLWTSWWGCQKGIFLVLAIFIVIIGIVGHSGSFTA